MALNGDDEINDLLALMGGEQAAAVPLPSKKPSVNEESNEVKSKKRKKKKSRKGNKHDVPKNIHDESIVSYADTRLSQNCFGWPSSSNNGQHLLYLGSGLLHNCKGYICNEQHTQHYGESKCQSCGKSAATHELCISSSWSGGDDEETKACHPQSIISVASIIIASRNARCLIGEHHPSANSEKQKKTKELLPQLNSTPSSSVMISNALDVYLGRILVVLKRMQNELPKPNKNRYNNETKEYRKLGCIASISASDVQLLQEKTSSLISSVQDYKNAMSQGLSINIIEKRLSAMSACDAVYYRCYYAAVVSLCSTDSDVDGSIMASIIPHPPTYFTCPGLAWDVSAGVESLRVFLGEANDNNKLEYLAAPLDLSTKQTLLKSWGLEERFSAGGRTSGTTHHHLLTLWQSRYLETIRHVWCTRYSSVKSSIALQQVAESSGDDSNRTQYYLNDSEDILKVHDTAHISPEVAQWRSDSVRDYPANFYAYATPTNEALQVITKYFESTNIEQILEAGAGTGYWSALLNAKLNSIKKEPVVAYDLTPPSSNNGKVVESNEYHGNIPTFMRVHQADTLSHALSSSAITSGTSTALLLCYPPPASDMAYNALSAHISKGGRIVMHVGEWQGLTGSNEFEALLTKEFSCQKTDVVPLPSWGTDATYLTIWSKKMSGDEDGDVSATIFSSAIGSCSVEQCSTAARKRCRYARSLQYCSRDCYQKHSTQRKAILALHMVHTTSGDELKYENDGHFMDLKQISIKRESNNQLSDRPRKKRKKKRR